MERLLLGYPLPHSIAGRIESGKHLLSIFNSFQTIEAQHLALDGHSLLLVVENRTSADKRIVFLTELMNEILKIYPAAQ